MKEKNAFSINTECLEHACPQKYKVCWWLPGTREKKEQNEK